MPSMLAQYNSGIKGSKSHIHQTFIYLDNAIFIMFNFQKTLNRFSGGTGMKKVSIILGFALLFSGCAQSKYQAVQEDHTRQISEVQENLAGLSQRVDQLDYDTNNNIASLSKKIDDVTLAVAEIKPEDTPEAEGEAPVGMPLSGAPAEEDIFEEPVSGAETTEEMPAETMLAKAEDALPMEELYKKAYGLYEKGFFHEAIAEFDKFIAAYPATEYTDNALYWQGESDYSMLKFEEAIATFERVVKEFPEENKAPDAQLKIGYSYIELQLFDEAKAALEKVVDLYPFSEAAKKAASKLNSL